MEVFSDRSPWRRHLADEGYTVLPRVFSSEAVANMIGALEEAFAGTAAQEAAVLGQEGGVYAAQNVLLLWPEAASCWRAPPLTQALAGVLGPRFGLVRVLFFDKPPQQSWALPWHKDLTIAVQDNRLPSKHFNKPTTKAQVPHVEAPQEILAGMLTARIHLDPASEENGALRVIPGSHHGGKALNLDQAPPRVVLAQAGDVLLLRPLVAHCSGKSDPNTIRHRRILHLEFAACPDLPDGYAWYTFLPGCVT
jgi:hypothetical protein